MRPIDPAEGADRNGDERPIGSYAGDLMGRRVLLVDDEPHIADVLCAYLERDGFGVFTASDGDTALAAIADGPPDLVILDVMLPGRSGFDVLRAMRSTGSKTPVIMLTARDEIVDRVAGLELGADDYVTKPFEPREVVARVGAVLRRSEAADGSGPDPSSSARSMRLSDLVIDPAAREVRRGDLPIELTRAEFDLLAALADRPGIVWTRDQLGESVFGDRYESFDRTLDSHVKNLRHKLDPRPDGGSYIETVRGVGYRAAREAPPR